MASLNFTERPHPLISLDVALAVLQRDLDRVKEERRRVVESYPSLVSTPFGPAVLNELLTDAEDDQRYRHDEEPV